MDAKTKKIFLLIEHILDIIIVFFSFVQIIAILTMDYIPRVSMLVMMNILIIVLLLGDISNRKYIL